uniref:Secreted protein n=1 Tax=Steinernema glaseri TaxID=37863 RepID=A0A1I7YN42_9BILA
MDRRSHWSQKPRGYKRKAMRKPHHFKSSLRSTPAKMNGKLASFVLLSAVAVVLADNAAPSLPALPGLPSLGGVLGGAPSAPSSSSNSSAGSSPSAENNLLNNLLSSLGLGVANPGLNATLGGLGLTVGNLLTLVGVLLHLVGSLLGARKFSLSLLVLMASLVAGGLNLGNIGLDALNGVVGAPKI